jgi:flavin-dependent dehydrogenase
VSLRKIECIEALRTRAGGVELAVRTAKGSETFCGPVLIGADGSNGQTRQLANGSGREPAWYSKRFALEAAIPYTALPNVVPAGDAAEDLVFDFAPLVGGYGWLFPKGDHVNIGVGTFADGNAVSLKRVTRELLATYTQQKLGVDLGSFPASCTKGQHLGVGGYAYVPQGRVLLVGDAAGLVDPLTGEGIHSALVSGQAAAAAVLTGGDVAAVYARKLAPLQQMLAFSARAAQVFYRDPERGFKLIRIPGVQSLVLKTYADGSLHTGLLTTLARLVNS